ncbi:MAG: helix-turn-helix domain-containing protein [Solirubrobacterales bacterium]|nr:helix-turn-helix domain-containing protein [Solirubrobacterales bacterium]
MSYEEPLTISITLSPMQVDEVLRAASGSRAPSLSTLIAESLGAPLPTSHPAENGAKPALVPGASAHLPSDTSDPRLSRSLLRGLSILTRFGAEREERGIVELAQELRMSPSTAHRYAQTLIELGLLERCPRSRKYRLPATRS